MTRPRVELERALALACEARRCAALAEDDARRALRAALADAARETWWTEHTRDRQLVDSLGTRWLVRSARVSRDGRAEELELVCPGVHVVLRGEVLNRHRLADHHVSVFEETRRTSAELRTRPEHGDDRRLERARLAAGDRE